MIVTNRDMLPEPLVIAVTRHDHQDRPNYISATQLIQPPQIYGLTKIHSGELKEDASDRIWSFLGTLLHAALETHAKGIRNLMSEQELTMQVEGWTVVGHYDLSELLLDGELLTDYKLTSVWSVKDGVKPEWEAQLNIYAELIRQAGRGIQALQIVAIGRDWSKSKARYDPSYPQKQVRVLPVPLWTREKALAYVTERVLLHQAAERGIWPECTPEERWARPTQYALMKKGQKKAVKLFEDREVAENWLKQILGGQKTHSIVERPGESIRCAAYCSVSEHCEQWAKLNPTLSDTLEESIKVASQRRQDERTSGK